MKTLALIFLAALLWQENLSESDIKGFWMTEAKDAIVEIYKKEDTYAGKIVWLSDPLDMYGQPLRDVMNPDPNKRSRPVLGLDILTGFAWDEDAWRKGNIYNFKTGHDYNAKLSIDEEGNLRLTGYYGILFFLGKTKIWTPVANPHEFGLR